MICAPKGVSTRPTSMRVREALFSILQPIIRGSVFVDLFAGSGAVGIEALSRGAAKVLFADSGKFCGKLIADNLRGLGIAVSLRDCSEIKCTDRPMDYRCQTRRNDAAMLCALQGMTTKYDSEKTRNNVQVVFEQSLKSPPVHEESSFARQGSFANQVAFSFRDLANESGIDSLRQPLASLGAFNADIVFADPPYALPVIRLLPKRLAMSGILNDGATVVIEHGAGQTMPDEETAIAMGFSAYKEKRYGDTCLSIYSIGEKT